MTLESTQPTESTGARGALAPLAEAPLAEERRPAPPPPSPRPLPPVVRHRPGLRVSALLAADAASAAGACVLTAPAAWTPAALPLGAALLLFLHARAGLYRRRVLPTALGDLPRLAGHCAVVWCVVAAVLAAWTPLPLAALAALAAVHAVLCCAARALVHAAQRRRVVASPHSVLVVGPGEDGRRLVDVLHTRREYGLRPVGLVRPAHEVPGRDTGGGLPVLTCPDDVVRAVVQNTVRDALFTSAAWCEAGTPELLRVFGRLDVAVWRVHDDVRPGADVPADHVWGLACARVDPVPRHTRSRAAKRALDVCLTVPALLAAAPLLAGCALAVRIADGPGVLFRQERIGLDGRPFTILKFRTLQPADARESATRWNVSGDRRMSRVGRFLRSTSLDELPQLLNVLRGDMSLVGPRPERPYFVAKFGELHPGYAARSRMPAGLTGLAQVHGLRGDTSIEDRARFDNHYIDSWTPWQDVRILLRTACSLLRGGGS